ncbi:MAG: DivIVA domain-containing protein [Acidimicrobiales bacterium]
MSVSGGASPIDPGEAANREFTRVRKGFDPAEVRALLVKLTDEVRRLRAREEELSADLERREAVSTDFDHLDPAAISRALGDETVRIIDTAREASEEIRAKAEENAGRVVRDAHERASRLTREALEARDAAAAEAEELGTTSRAEAEALLRDARAEAEALLAEAESDAASLREEAALVLDEKTTAAQLEAVEIRSNAEQVLAEAEEYARQRRADADADAEAAAAQAELDAEAVLEEAREAGREMIREAKEARERMIRDLAERRHASRQQLEALRAGRERLIEAFGTAREALDEATDELVDSLPSAREAADAAARAVPDDLDEAVVELDTLIAAGADTDTLIEGAPGLFDHTSSTALDDAADAATEESHETEGKGEADDDEASSDVTDEIADVDASSEADADDVSDEAVEDVADEAVDAEDDAEAADDDEPDEDVADDAESAVAPVGRLRLVSSNDDGPSPVGLEALTEATAVSAVAAEAPKPAERSGEVEELFARLRADRGDDLDDDDDEDDDDLDEDDDYDDEDDDDDDHRAEVTPISAGAVVIDLSAVANADATSDEGDGGDAEADELDPAHAQQVLLDERDAVLGDLSQGLSRRIRRVVTDQENELLDLVRRHRKLKDSDHLVPSLDDQLIAYRTAIHKDLREILAAGARFLADGSDEEGASADIDLEAGLDTLMTSVAEWAIDPLRAKLARVVDESDDTSPDRSELVDRVRATYREWRNDRIGELAGDIATLAFSTGLMAAAAPGQKLCWIVDHGGLPCADGEDNQLAGPVAVGEEYPTGDTCPPAHPGCRCLLVAASRAVVDS